MIVVSFDNCLSLLGCHRCSHRVVINAERNISDHSLQEIDSQEDEPNWLLYCVDESGKVYCATSQQFYENLRPSSTDSIDIFSDLLEQDLDDDIGLEFIESTVPVFKLTDNHVKYEVAGKPRSIVSYDDVIVVLSAFMDRLVFTALKVDTSDNKHVVKEEVKKNSICLRRENDDHGTYMGKIITCSLLEEAESRKSTDSINIDKNLFKALFGTDILLLNAPVYLFCPPDGNVYAVSLNSFFSETRDEVTLFDRHPVDNVKMKMLCETSCRVVDILTLTFPTYHTVENDVNVEDVFHVLLVCCSNGSIVAFHYDQNSKRHEYISQLTVRGPIVASNTFQNRLYHSTSSHIYESSFEVVNDPHSFERVRITTVKSRKHAQIKSISVEKDATVTEAEDSPCILHCIQKDGQHRSFDSSVAFNKESDGFSSVLHIKDVILAIDKTDREQERITESINTCEKLLEQISIASFLLNRYLSRSETLNVNDDKPPIALKHKIMMEHFRHSEGQGQVELNCELTNQMPRNLSPDWSLEISAVPLSSTSYNKSSHPSRVVPLLEGFKFNETTRVGIVIPIDFVLSGFDILVTLNLDISHLLETQDGNCLSINVFSKRLNILNFVMSKQVLDNTVRYLSTVEDTTHMIEDLAHQQPLCKCLVPDKTDHEKESSVTVIKCLHFTNIQYQQLTNQYGPGPTCVLKFLLKDSTVKETDIQKDRCHIMTLTGADLILEVKDITTIQQREKTCVSLTMQSDLSSIAALSLALDMLLKETKFQTSFPTSVEELKILNYKLQALDVGIQTLTCKNLADKDMKREIGNLYQRLRSIMN